MMHFVTKATPIIVNDLLHLELLYKLSENVYVTYVYTNVCLMLYSNMYKDIVCHFL